MKINVSRLIIPLLILLAIDIYVFQAIKTVTLNSQPLTRKWIYALYWGFTVLTVCFFLTAMISAWQEWPKYIRNYGMAIIIMVYVSKLLVVPFLTMDDLIRGGKWIYSKTGGKLSTGEESLAITRNQFILGIGLMLSAIPIASLSWGMIKGPYSFRTRKKKLSFPNLPQAFHGLKVLQISDIHTGSWVSPEPMERAVKMINSHKADIVLFTGDLVNEKSNEALPYIDTLKKINAPMGVYSSLGNHDYGDYMNWPDEESKKRNFDELLYIHKALGWKLLRNENLYLEKDGDKIALAACENWSASARFTKYGDLKKTLKGIEDAPFTILMSHDPSHWEAEILPHPHHVDITLAGHTHGMQFGVDLKWYRWSPAQWFYKQWADLYNRDKQYIYVNRGLGFIGYPGRVGVDAEITVLELSRG